MSECTTCWTLKEIGYSSSRPFFIKEQEAEATNPHGLAKNWKSDTWKDVNLDFCDDRFRIWYATWNHGCILTLSVDQPCGGGVKVWEKCSWHTLGPLAPTRFTIMNMSGKCCAAKDAMNSKWTQISEKTSSDLFNLRHTPIRVVLKAEWDPT